jgi:predicted acylesterase/phospholipase RssA
VDTVRLFRSYRNYSAGEYVDMTIWQAARATSAAPTYFKRLKIGPSNAQEEFLDGGVGSNNPTKLMMREASKAFEETDVVACIVSLGTGVMDISEFKTPTFGQKIIPKELINVLKKMATDCEVTEKEVSHWFSGKPGVYFRFNVERGLEDI